MARRGPKPARRADRRPAQRAEVVSIHVKRDEANARFAGAVLPTWDRVEDDVCAALASGLRDVRRDLVIRERVADLIDQLAVQIRKEGEWAWLMDLGVPATYVRQCAVISTIAHVYETGCTPLEMIMAMVEWLDGRRLTQ